MLAALSRDLAMVADPVDADVVHVHTWYTHLAGLLARLAYGIPLVLTVHSLEPLRPWKREQLGGGYDVSSWIERTAIETADAVVAVSQGTREDVLRLFDVAAERVHVIHNGIDADFYHPDPSTGALERHGIDPAVPYVLFVGRITRQKGIVHLVRAIRHLDPGIGVVLCAGQPDTPEIAAEMERGSRPRRPSVPTSSGSARWSVARRRASSTPTRPSSAARRSTSRSGSSTSRPPPARRPSSPRRWAASPRWSSTARRASSSRSSCAPDDPMSPIDPDRFELNLAGAINALMADAATREVMGRAARRRAVERFSWDGSPPRPSTCIGRSCARRGRVAVGPQRCDLVADGA